MRDIKPKSNNQISKIGGIFAVALAVRKFQRFATQKFFASLDYAFDKNAAMEELRELYCKNPRFFMIEFLKLSYFTRMFSLTTKDFNSIEGGTSDNHVLVSSIYRCLEDGCKDIVVADQRMVYFLCASLKHLTNNSDCDSLVKILKISTIAQLIRTSLNSSVTAELVALLGYFIERSSKTLSKEMSSELETLVDSLELSQDTKDIFLTKLEAKTSPRQHTFQKIQEIDSKLRTKQVHWNMKKRPKVTTKFTQAIRSKQEIKKSEEAEFRLLNFNNCIKSRDRRQHISLSCEETPPQERKDGSDQSIIRDTWEEVINLYLLASRGQTLKDQDIDYYLADKFIGKHYFKEDIRLAHPAFYLLVKSNHSKGKAFNDSKSIQSYFINRMCASIFLKASKKHMLNSNTIDKLFRCVTDFDNLVTVLNMNENYADMFAEQMHSRYRFWKEITDPNIIVTLTSDLRKKTTEEYERRSLFQTETAVKKKRYNLTEVKEVIMKDIMKVREDAIGAIYNCSVRDKSILFKERVERIRTCLDNKNKECHDDVLRPHLFKLIELAEDREDFDYCESFRRYISIVKDEKNLDDIEVILRFLINQAKDLKRSCELFKDDSISTLIGLLNNDSYISNILKEDVLEIINTYLTHEGTESLSPENSNLLAKNVFDSNDFGIINIGLTSLLLNTDKTRWLSPSILRMLMDKFDDNENVSSYIVFILSRGICTDPPSEPCFLRDSEDVEKVSSKLRCSEMVTFTDGKCEDGQQIIFENPSEKTGNDPHRRISSLAAMVILKSTENKIPLTTNTVDNLLLNLNSSDENDKQAKIAASKCLYNASKYMSLESDNLIQMVKLINSDIYDVGVYIQAAYLNLCAQVASNDKCLDSIHLNHMSSLYVSQSMLMNEHDFEGEMNTNVFRTLLYEAGKQRFCDRNVFILFENILNLNEKYAEQILQILLIYTSKYSVPETTVRTLENVLNLPEHFANTLSILQNLILISQMPVTSKTLNIFIDHLYMTMGSHLRFFFFKILEKVRRYQDLDDGIFWKFELAKAGYALEYNAVILGPSNELSVIKFIQAQTERGMQLPVNTRLVLENEVGRKDVLPIFANISRNGQIIHLNLMNRLIKMFDPENESVPNENILLVSIFENAAKNNQTLPQRLLEKLEESLSRNDLLKNVRPVFIYLAQKGEKLAKLAIDKLLDSITDEGDPVAKQEILSSLGSLIDANQEDCNTHFRKISTILTRELKSGNFNIQKLCLVAIGKLSMATKQLDDELLHEIIQIGTNLSTCQTIRSQICTLFGTFSDDWNPLIGGKFYRAKLKLANLNCSSSKNMLVTLETFAHLEDGLLEQNYKQLNDIIDGSDESQQDQALSILHKSTNKLTITDEVLESVAILYLRTMTPNLRTSCMQLLNEIAASGKILKDRALKLWSEEMNRNHGINNFFQCKVYKDLKYEFLFDVAAIEKLMGLIKISEDLSGMDSLVNFITTIVRENTNSECFENQSFVMMIEMCLLRKEAIEVALPCYCRIIKNAKHSAAEEYLEKMTEYFNESINDQKFSIDHQIQIVETMFWSCKLVQLPNKCLKLFENNLYNENAVIRSYSFGALRCSSNGVDHVHHSAFNDFCEKVIEKLTPHAKIDKTEEDLDLLEIIISVDFLDVDVFKINSKDTWKKELLISDLFKRYHASEVEKVQFYVAVSLFESMFHISKSWKILSQIQLKKFDSFVQIVEILTLLLELGCKDDDDAIRMLSIHGLAPFKSFKQQWCMKKIQTRIPEDDTINKCYLNELVEILCLKFDVKFIGELFSCIKSIDNMRAFEDLVHFCSNEKVVLTDVDIKAVELNEFRRTIEAKQLCNHVRCQEQIQAERKSLQELTKSLLNEGWSFSQLQELFKSYKLPQIKYLMDLLRTIHKYDLISTSFNNCKQILSDTKNFTEIIKKINRLAIENHFQMTGKTKDLKELLVELKQLNSSKKSLIDFIDNGSLNINENIFNPMSHILKNWKKEDILSWATEVKQQRKKFTNHEAIAVIMKANLILTGLTLTDAQILSSLIALEPEEEMKGKLLEVATGEGKSTIICILAIINGLRGKTVDIITSSPVLAERDAKNKSELYSMFKLICASNIDKTIYVKGAKRCYKADIVYGDMPQFQFDTLRDNYSQLGTLDGRTCAMAIIDEVDSMLIDDSSNIARLSSTAAGMDSFQAVYVFIWQHLITIKEKLIEFDDQLYYIDGKIDFENGKVTLEFLDDPDDNSITKITDLKSYLQETDDVSQIGEIVDDLEKYLKRCLESYLDSMIKERHVIIPSNFSDFFQMQKPKWISNAIEALRYEENVHYIVHDGQIKPVDYYNTGIIQANTNWSDGLHQFLQLKHNLKMTSETLTTNFLSNIGFINRYEYVYGLTGTLGSQATQNLLKKLYKVELINMPQRCQRQYLELEPIVVEGEENWLKEIASNVELEVKKERGSLIICETIMHANKINEMLIHTCKLRPSAVKLYTMNDMNQETNVERCLPGEVIIATNLAGRGMDIQTEKIESTGGLHVILTFLPRNQRVENQAFGRTSRQGKRGTGLMIINARNIGESALFWAP